MQASGRNVARVQAALSKGEHSFPLCHLPIPLQQSDFSLYLSLHPPIELKAGHKVTELRKHGNDLHGGPTVRVAQGNFIAAKRRGVVHGIDFQETGHVRYVDASAISERLDSYALSSLLLWY